MDRDERLQRTASMAYNKGLINNPGENNCFLNSAVQVLWHLDVFRRSFREIKGHYCMGQSCIFCALDFIFKQFQYSSNDALPPDGLRVALAVAFKNEHRFQLGDMDDAAECFENILAHMHFLVAKNEHDDACTAKHCISHQKFAMQVIEQTICECGEQSEPLPFFQLVHYVSASALCKKARSLKGWDDSQPIEDQFGVLLRKAGQDTRECPSPDCKEKVQVQRLLLNCPDIVSVGLIWDSESPDADHIADVLECIGTTLKLSDLYHQVYDERAKEASLQLVGIVTYYGKHYSTFFFHSKLRSWIYFDDARVKEIGSQWAIMMDKCRRCHYQPLLLLYANPNGTPVNADSAPKTKIYVNGAAQRKASEASQSGKRLVPGREVGDGRSDGERSPASPKKVKSRHSNGTKQEKKSSYSSKKSLSSGDLASPHKALSRSPSNASDTAASSSGKERHKPSFRRIGNAIMQTLNPALAVGHWKSSKKKKSRRSSTGSSESSGDHDLVDLSPKNEDAKLEIMKLYEQSKAINAAQGSLVNHDSGISSVPSSAASSAGGSVSSTDTNHGGSDEDLMDFTHTWRQSKYDNWPVVHQNDRCEDLLQEAENFLVRSQNAENYRDFVSALGYCTEAAIRFRMVAEENGVNLQTKNYANMKRNSCNARARNLRHLVQSHPPPDERTPSLSKQQEEDLLHKQRHRDQVIMRQQQQVLPQYGSVPRKPRAVKDSSAPEVGSHKVLDPLVSSGRGPRVDTNYNYGNYPDAQHVSTLPAKPKLKATVYSSGHYVNRGNVDKPGSGRMGPAACTQQIKPDSMCYSPVHYDRESEIAARMQNLDLCAPSPSQGQATVITVGENRTKVSESRRDSRPPPPPKRVSSTTIYISPPNQNSRAAPAASYDPTVYSSNSSPSSHSATASRSRPRVYYQGNLAASSHPSVRERPPSPARSTDDLNSVHSYQGTASSAPKVYERRSPKYVPAPPYNPLHQREYLKSHSTSSLARPWYQTAEDDSLASNAHNLRQVSARIITDRPVCERCRCVPIERRQRLCAGCENELHQRHSNSAGMY